MSDYVSYREAANIANVSVITIHGWVGSKILDKEIVFDNPVVIKSQVERISEIRKQSPNNWKRIWLQEKGK
jgi:hypothetical protein